MGSFIFALVLGGVLLTLGLHTSIVVGEENTSYAIKYGLIGLGIFAILGSIIAAGIAIYQCKKEESNNV
jgi:hypothetical protein